MDYHAVVRFAHASNRALAQAGTDNRARALIELAWPDWQAFLREAEQHFMQSGDPNKLPWRADHIGEVQLYGCIIRPKPDTIPASVAFGAALSAMPALSKAAGCYTGIHVTALDGVDPRTKE